MGKRFFSRISKCDRFSLLVFLIVRGHDFISDISFKIECLLAHTDTHVHGSGRAFSFFFLFYIF